MTTIKLMFNEKVTVFFDTSSELVAVGFMIFIWHILVMIMAM